MDNDTILRLTTLILTTITAMFTAWLTYKTKQVEKTANDTHELVNHQSLITARQHELTARSLSRLTGSGEDHAELVNATRLREEAEAKQASLKRR